MKDNHKPEIRTNECGYIEIGRKSIKSKRPSRKDIGKETDDTSQQATESRIPHLVRQTKPNGEIADWRNNIQIREESENKYREHETET